MSTMNGEDLRKIRTSNSNNLPGAKGPMYGSYTSGRHNFAPQNGSFHQDHFNTVMPVGHTDDAATLAEDFGRMSVHSTNYPSATKLNSHMMNQSSDSHGVTNGPTMPLPSHGTVGSMGGVPLARQPFMYNSHVMFPGTYLPQQIGQAHASLASSPAMFTSIAPQYLVHGSYANPHHIVHNNSPLSQGWNSSRATSGEMPTLITPPRDSTSSNEDDAPGTPFTQYTSYGGYQPGIAFMDRSPHSVYAWSTPSPSQQSFTVTKAQVSPQNIDQELLRLIRQAPGIPPAVPSTTPLKSLDRCLENSHGITNVYIRGLQPDTTDEMLYNLAARFGEIASSKSIIDHSTGLCKGYGFVKYHNYTDAMNCIRGFHAQGYETSFARESFYSQLKKLADEGNTNLYVSNLPKDMNEHELGGIFSPHKVCSSRILRDASGNGRGVGFARFESRDVCEEVIKTFNNTPVSKPNGQEHLIQIRYADTQEQKSLKHQTTQARDWRTQEYQAQTTGRPISAASFHGVGAHSVPDYDFESYMASTAGSKTSSNLKYQSETFGRFARERLTAVIGHLSPPASPATPHPSLPISHQVETAETRSVLGDDDEVKNPNEVGTNVDEISCGMNA